MKFYVQCRLKKRVGRWPEDDGNKGQIVYRVTTTWLPEKYAKKYKWLKLKNKDGEWEDHWQVWSVGTRKPERFVLDHERDYLDQREASDV